MDTFMSDFAKQLAAMHRSMNKSLDGLTPEALNWVPGPEMNSLAVLAAHTAGSERYWIGDVAGLEPSGRVRSEEFEVEAAGAEELIALLDTALSHSQSVLGRLTSDQLTDIREMEPTPEQTFTVGWALLHALGHTSVHRGHIELTRQLWDQQQAG